MKKSKYFGRAESCRTEMKDGKDILGHLEAKFTAAESWYNSIDVNSCSFHLDLWPHSTPEVPDTMYSICSIYFTTILSAESFF